MLEEAQAVLNETHDPLTSATNPDILIGSDTSSAIGHA
jgi:hypothetical protein